MKMKINIKEYDDWIKELISIHRSLNTWYSFAVGFIGERKKLLEAKEGIDKLEKLIEFLNKLRANASD